MFVTKRNKTQQQFSVEKVKKVIAWAIGQLDLSPVVLESRFNETLTNGIKTDDIHQNLIHQARVLCTPQEPEWSVVAGRLETMRRWKNTKAYDKPFADYIYDQVKAGNYKHPAIALYSEKDMEYLGSVIKQERDLDHSFGSVLTAQAKYLMKGECIQQMHMVNAMILASKEHWDNCIPFAERLYEALSLRKISLATPFLSNLRANKSIASCFILQVDDSIDSIFDNIKNMALISKNGGGIGVDLSKVRAKGATIGGVENASKGVTGWIKIMNDTMVAVDQNGKRVGSSTIHLPIWHRDLEDFLELQTENGDFRKKAFDIFPQIGIYDLFMEEVLKKDGGIWHTFCPHEVKQVLGIELYGVFGDEFKNKYSQCVTAYNNKQIRSLVYNAKDILKSIMKVQFETGLPYLSFLDEINRHNPNKHIGYIPCTNLCTESFSVVEAGKYAHVCSLASVVAGRIGSPSDLMNTVRLTTRLLDNAIDLADPPIYEGVEHKNQFRTIGIGIQGLHDYIANNNLQWNDYTAITRLAEHIQYYAILESVNLAHDKGAYPFFKGSEWDNGEMIEKFKKESVSPELDWDSLGEAIRLFGIRNSQLTSPAPNTSTSVFMDASAGVMPVYSGFFNEDNKTGKFSVYGMYIKENPLSYERTASRQSQVELSKVVSSIQKFTDTGVSAEYIFDLNKEGASAKDLFDTIVSAWRNKTKAVYYIRSIKKGATIDGILGGTSVCVSCSG